MRPSVWFIVPAHGRAPLTRVCLRQLKRTCLTLRSRGIDAAAVVIAEDDNLDTAAEMGFGTIEQSNQQLGKKWNDGYELAGRTGVDYVVPFGSDDWVLPAWVELQVRAEGEFRCSRRTSVVSEDAQSLATLEITYEKRGGPAMGTGVRMIPTGLLQRLGYRPADDVRDRGIDTSVWLNVSRMLGRAPRVSFVECGPFQIVDWKSAEQLNAFEPCLKYQVGELLDPWRVLAGRYPAEALTEMRALHVPEAAVA